MVLEKFVVAQRTIVTKKTSSSILSLLPFRASLSEPNN